MTQSYQIVIVGGGNAGISVAAQLLLKNSKLKIAVIESSDKHSQPAWTLVGGGVFDINKTICNEAEVMPKNTHWIRRKVVGFDPEQNTVRLDNNDTVHYEYLWWLGAFSLTGTL